MDKGKSLKWGFFGLKATATKRRLGHGGRQKIWRGAASAKHSGSVEVPSAKPLDEFMLRRWRRDYFMDGGNHLALEMRSADRNSSGELRVLEPHSACKRASVQTQH